MISINAQMFASTFLRQTRPSGCCERTPHVLLYLFHGSGTPQTLPQEIFTSFLLLTGERLAQNHRNLKPEVNLEII